MPHDIIDNRTRELAPEINNLLTNSIHALSALRADTCYPSQAVIQHPTHKKERLNPDRTPSHNRLSPDDRRRGQVTKRSSSSFPSPQAPQTTLN
jgi:hypothetical protein